MGDIILSALTEGVFWSIVAIGLYISFRILHLSDMTTEGSFPLGACLAIVSILNDLSPLMALAVSFIGGALAGLVTGVLINRLRIPNLLAGILTMSAFYSINLKIMQRPNLNILGKNTLVNYITHQSNVLPYAYLWLGSLMVALLLTALYFFFKTEVGQALIASGDNAEMAMSSGIPVERMKILGLMLANGIIALGGGLLAQKGNFADVNMGIGVIVVALASIIIGEVIFPYVTFGQRLICIVLGSIIYRFLLASVISLKVISANDFKLFSALLIAVCLALPLIREKIHR
ncbi:ABC transporter permease [Amygdalobacter nucleatus]|uniref:ABC transporter permease n=1 Tax=Amygdalobacter nucleatus TaxID=3029274 RepID=UPI0027A92B65|nr:ABC transporter permease [Amygdalobacter nucleatus]WEG36748.1 ABC transporter permease [Amygdalobacter nucleatus]